MRSLALRIDQLSAWGFVGIAVIAFGSVRAGRLFAILHQSRGGMELGAIATLAVFLGVLIFAVRRRQVNSWRTTVQVLAALVIGNALALLLVWPFIPTSYSIALLPMLRDTVLTGGAMAVMTLPVAVIMLWLSRRYGSHSQITERRMRVVREVLSRRRQPVAEEPLPDAAAGRSDLSSSNPA